MAKGKLPDPIGFQQAARTHQRDWVTDYLNVYPTHPKRVTLPVAEALNCRNFYAAPEVRHAVLERFPRTFTLNASGHPSTRAADALSSAHVPFNLFAPLRAFIVTPALAPLFTTLVARPVTSVSDIRFEFADPTAKKSIGDNTSFDVCVFAQEPRSGSPSVVVGIEVKYTEGPYSWGNTEKRRMFAADDPYHRLTASSGLFKAGATSELRTRHLKQMWRNMLLGVATADATHAEFVYLHLYPSGNIYQAAACSLFGEQLTPKGLGLFRPITYEEFLTAASETLPADALPWLEYVRTRYLF